VRAAGFDALRIEEVVTELAEEGRRSNEGLRSEGDGGCECFGVVVCASRRECGGPVVSIAPELRWRACILSRFSVQLKCNVQNTIITPTSTTAVWDLEKHAAQRLF
jgi:hypothetical protein